MSTPSDLHALFANLKTRSGSAAPSNSSNPLPSHPVPSSNAVDGANFFNRSTPVPSLTSPPIYSSQRMIPPTPASNGEGQDRAQSLLSLLKSGQPIGEPSQMPSGSSGPSGANGSNTHGRGISASDLVASFMSGSAGGNVRPSNGAQPLSSQSSNEPPSAQVSAGTPQNALLALLNRTNSTPSQAKGPVSGLDSSSGERLMQSIERPDPVARKASPIRVFGSNESREATPFEPPSVPAAAAKENKTLFTYTNPFEALKAASRNQTPQPQTDGNEVDQLNHALGEKRLSKEASPEPAATRRKLTPRGPLRKSSTNDGIKQELLPDQDGVAPESPEEDVRDVLASRKEDPVIKQEEIEDMKADITELHQSQATTSPAVMKTQQERTSAVKEGAFEDAPTRSDPHADEQTIEPHVNGTQEQNLDEQDRIVPVYNFPIKPFVSITLNLPQVSSIGLRDDGVMEISRFKKEFDQLDRTLAAATSKYITYSLVKNGGMRVIRQDDGDDRQIFKSTRDRIFNVAMGSTASNSTPTDEQSIIGTGISGAVYYATIFRDGNDFFDQDALDSESLIFPPYPLGDENTSGGLLKTRAKKSSRHPEFFAIGRGKHIHLIWPTLAMSPKYGVHGDDRRVDIEKFFKERTLKITTGKAGKDFSFSEDDSMIVSLDKTGRLRFWDIRQLTDETNATASKVQAIDIRTPLLTLSTSSATTKAWPTSALFIDKLRPYSKGTALRYVLVGLRQNHTLQLWDICLGKAVQEIHFPHETENDGICSITYHPGSGIIVVGHPTRNSLYFIHLSAPRYNLQPMLQATYIERLAVKDPDLPKPESTACMSGIREMSFAAKGQLRSVELLPLHRAVPSQPTEDTPPLFELYVVHSRGVTCLSIKKQDLGWNEESKTVSPVNALEEGLITMKPLEPIDIASDNNDINGDSESQPMTKTGKKKNQKPASDDVPTIQPDPAALVTPSAPTVTRGLSPEPDLVNGSVEHVGEVLNGTQAPAAEPQSKKKKKKVQQTQQASALNAPQKDSDNQRSSRSVSPQKGSTMIQAKNTPVEKLAPKADHVPKTAEDEPAQPLTASDGKVTVGIAGDWLSKEMRKLEAGVANEVKKDFENLYRNIDKDRKIQDAASSARQDAMLRLISETLSENVEKSLARIVMANFQQIVVPSITNVTIQAVSDVIARSLHTIVPNEVGKHMPAAISTAMLNPQLLRHMTDNVSQKMAHTVENEFTEILHTTITPAFKQLAISSADSMAQEVERRVMQQIQTYEADRIADQQKIAQLTETLQGVAHTLSDMAQSQVRFQEQILKDRAASTRPRSQNGVPLSSGSVPIQSTPEDGEVVELQALIRAGDFQEATIKWLQSSQQARVFNEVFMPIGPAYLASEVSPLFAFSVGITLSHSLSENTIVKLEWIDAALRCVDIRDPEIEQLAERLGGILADLISKLEPLYMSIHQRNDNDPVLRMIPGITKRARELRQAFGIHANAGRHPPAYQYGVA